MKLLLKKNKSVSCSSTLTLLLLLTQLLSYAQERNGIKFEKRLTWTEIKKRARLEKKFIFIDCYTTWCGPCKLMDKEVYPKKSVGDYMNAHFISVKVQMDTSALDKDDVRKWYADANKIAVDYDIKSYPSYLFFSHEGKLVHRAVGAIRDTDFIKVASNTFDENKQYCTLLERYKQGARDFTKMRYLAGIAKSIGDQQTADEIAREYVRGYLNKNVDQLLLKRNIDFILTYLRLLTSDDNTFKYCYVNGSKVDSALNNKGISQSIVDYVITKEEINQTLWKDGQPLTQTPPWDSLAQILKKKYDDYCAERNLLNAKLRWYGYKQDWSELTQLNVEKIKRFGLDTAGFPAKSELNNMIYNVIFQHSNDQDILKQGIKWMEILLSVQYDGINIDTYANLLYKIGQRQEAIDLEKKALSLDPTNEEIQGNYEKMLKGEPTWAESDKRQ